jgi:pimeloyl-ACP methyl ester carboxylesterase
MSGSYRYFAVAIWAMMICWLGGCSSTTRPGNLQLVRTDSDKPRAGNAYLLRGFIGVFSEGIDSLTRKLNAAGIRASVFQDDQWYALARKLRQEYRKDPNHEPLILIGHSYGADDAIRVARELRKDRIQVDLLVTLDPVTPPRVPDNVKRCINIYQSNGIWDVMPWLRGVPLVAESDRATQLVNYDVRTNRKDLLDRDIDHFNIEKKPRIHNEVIAYAISVCPPRDVYLLSAASREADRNDAVRSAAPRPQEQQASVPYSSGTGDPGAQGIAAPRTQQGKSRGS